MREEEGLGAARGPATQEWLTEYPGWNRITCGSCSGHGQVGDYGMFGTDFNGPDECEACGGSGYIWEHLRSGSYAQWPGGPFLGRQPKPRR